jgi:hypothetical protein
MHISKLQNFGIEKKTRLFEKELTLREAYNRALGDERKEKLSGSRNFCPM